MDMLGLGLFYEELTLGRRFRTVGRTITDADITIFTGATGMTEVLFTDAEFLKAENLFGGRPAPGALVYSLAEGLLVHSTLQHTGLAFLHMELEMKGPVLVGDTIHVECEVIERRLSKSKPGRGLVRTRNSVLKQDGTTALIYTPLRMIKCRPSAPHG
jgi:acyl dehydratase